MFTYTRQIYLREADATGMLYFAEQLNLGAEAFETYFRSKGFVLHEMIEQGNFLMPVVHAEADFSSPLRAGSRVEVALSLGKIGTTSFTLQTTIMDLDRNLEVGITKIVHVTVSGQTERPIPIPELVLTNLRQL